MKPMKNAPATLSAVLFEKGAAVPTPAVSSDLSSLPATRSTNNAVTQLANSAGTYHKALTLKLDEDRYRALKLAGIDLDLSSQDILVEALDAWLLARPR